MAAQSSKGHVLEELQLIQCSLLPDEHLTFLEEPEAWLRALEQYSEDPIQDPFIPSSEALFSIHLDRGKVWFEIMLSGSVLATFVSVKGENISRDEQEEWQAIISRNLKDLHESEADYPIYELLSMHLLPLQREDLKARLEASSQATDATASDGISAATKEIYHALFTSHHLISPNKRRSLQHWSSSLSLTGFAKVGYPGVIYAQGEKSNIVEFVDNIKAMQWLALKLRFVEPLPAEKRAVSRGAAERSWKEFEKVGEVVEEMRRLGREEYVVEMGIGSAGTK